ncbi:hypothetical protein AB0M11_07205 [Streptomyces sp. NPDC051987]|uniref:RICIN domain-containing protein n=1 Tax=Streptomyces sp. NPDC051987 TaxID=3155808 RepID=UPI0034137790
MRYTKSLDAERAKEDKVGVRLRISGGIARRAWAAGAALVLTLGLSVLNANPASAYVDANFLRNWETGLCLTEVQTDANSGIAHAYPCYQGDTSQQWQPDFIEHGNYDLVRVINVRTKHCLTLDGSGTLRISWCDGTFNQRFWAKGSSWDQVQLQSWYFGTCLDSNRDGAVYMHACNDGGYQKWKLGY